MAGWAGSHRSIPFHGAPEKVEQVYFGNALVVEDDTTMHGVVKSRLEKRDGFQGADQARGAGRNRPHTGPMLPGKGMWQRQK